MFLKGIGEMTYAHDIIYHARNNRIDNVKTILDRKLCSIEHTDPRWHKMALHWIAETGLASMVQLLVDRGASTSAQDEFGNTALHYATEAGFLETSKVLVAAGSPLDTVDGWGLTALQCAQQNFQHEVVERLEQELVAASREQRMSAVHKTSDIVPTVWINT